MHGFMLAGLVDTLPAGPGWLYEPKLDGFRAQVGRERDRVTITSRNGRPLTARFAEVLEAARGALPGRCLVDGELVCPAGGGVSFAALQARMAGDRRLAATLVAFDILELDGADLRHLPLVDRRAALERSLAEHGAVALMPQTADAALASGWVEGCGMPGVEGAVAKLGSSPYRVGRGWMKVKRRRSADVVVGGHRHGRLLVGLYGPDGRLHHVGETGPLSVSHAGLLPRLVTVDRGRTFTGRAPGRGRWAHDRYAEWVECEPRIVVEVSYTLVDGTRFRHVVRMLRLREDKRPMECTVEQLLDSG
jgi:ATP-dependent DNA ligase